VRVGNGESAADRRREPELRGGKKCRGVATKGGCHGIHFAIADYNARAARRKFVGFQAES